MRKILIAVVAMLMLVFATPALAEHPQDNEEQQAVAGGGVPWNVAGRDNPNCTADHPTAGYESADEEFWICVPDQVYPGDTPVPGQGGYYWEPVELGFNDPNRADPDSPDDLGGDIEWARKWVPITIPGYPGAVMRMLTRTEWVNPTGVGRCPNVTGGCKLKAGADINFRRNGQPFQISKTWFNRAIQLYTYNFTTHAWTLKQDTGWQYPGAAAAAYMSSWTNTLNYGVAPYGDTWYWFRDQTRVWNGSTWVNTVLDPKPGADGHVGIVDPKPGDSMNVPPVDGKTKLPKVREPKKLTVAPSLPPVAG